MSIKAFFTSKKSSNDVGLGLDEILTKDSSQFITAQKSSSDRVLLDTASSNVFRVSALKTALGTSSGRVLKATSHGASVGDLVRFEAGAANQYYEVGVVYIADANTIVLATEPPSAITAGDTFYILRYITTRTDATGAPIISVTQGANAAGTLNQAALSGTTAQTVSIPSNAVGFLIQAPSTNIDNIRFCVGATATTTQGVLLEPGRSEGPFNLAAAVSVCAAAATGTNEYIIQWIRTS